MTTTPHIKLYFTSIALIVSISLTFAASHKFTIEKHTFENGNLPVAYRILELHYKGKVRTFREGQKIKYKVVGDYKYRKGKIYEIGESNLVITVGKYLEKEEIPLKSITFIKTRPKENRGKRILGWMLFLGILASTAYLSITSRINSSTKSESAGWGILAGITIIAGAYFLGGFTQKTYNLDKWKPKTVIVQSSAPKA